MTSFTFRLQINFLEKHFQAITRKFTPRHLSIVCAESKSNIYSILIGVKKKLVQFKL